MAADHLSRPAPRNENCPRIRWLKKIFSGEIGVREKTGRNDGDRIKSYLAYTGNREGVPWCAAFVCWVLGEAGIPNPRSAWCPDLFRSNNVTWNRQSGSLLRIDRGKLPALPHAGDVFGLYFAEKGRIAHVGFVDSIKGNWLITVEGNTNAEGSREGDGVYRKRRLLQSIYAFARWE